MRQIHFQYHYSVILIFLLINACTQSSPPSITIVKTDPIGWKSKEPCKIMYSENNREVVLTGKIKCRGGVSSRYYKHSYSLELDNSYPLCDLPSDDDWILNANYIDKTFIRHKLSFDLFRQMSEKNIAPKCSYSMVKLNDKEAGLYVLMEKVNASWCGLDKDDSLALLFKDPPVFYKERLPFVQDSLNYYEQKYPKISDADKTEYIERFKDFLFNSTDMEFSRGISDWIDIENVMDWHILLLLSNNGDGIMKNFYLYKINSDTPFRITIWDYDHSYGRDGDNELNMLDRELDCNRSVLIERLMNIENYGYPEKLKRRWFELRKLKIISMQNVKRLIRNNDRTIRNVMDKNFEIWPADSKWYYDANSYRQEIDLMLHYFKIRIKQLDYYFKTL